MPRTIVLIAYKIRSLWNFGSRLRSCGAFGVSHVYLTGYTATPPRREISKTALGADEWVPWTHAASPLDVMAALRRKGFRILALERTKQSIPLQSCKVSWPVCLIVGHEVLGVPKDILAGCDAIVEIPMAGRKESLNVAVAAGIALYQLATERSACA